MTLTNFPNGISSFNVPVLGGLMGIPFTGNWFFVDAVNGSDGNEGDAENPFATLAYAYTQMRDGRNDVAVIVGDGTSAATQRLSEQLVWAKDAAHILGMTAPSGVAQRARISTATGATANIANLVSVTASGCAFVNFSLFQGVGEAATAEQLWQDAGERNYYGNVAFGGMGSANGAANSGSYSLQLYGGGERLFERCFFGVDTQDRTVANTNVQLRKNASNVAATRDTFRECMFAMRATQTTPTFIDVNQSGAIDRFTWFDRCKFNNFGTASPAVVAVGHASQGGNIVFDNCGSVGSTAWAATNAALFIVNGFTGSDVAGLAAAQS